MSFAKWTKRWSPRVLLRRLLMLDDTPHAIALGTSIGMLIGMTPTVGLQLILVVLLATLTRRLFYFNRPAALITVYVSNPLTIVPIYYGLYLVGAMLAPGEITPEQLEALLQYDGFEGWWRALMQLFVDIGWPLLVGTVIVAPLSGLATYPAMLWLVKKFRSA